MQTTTETIHVVTVDLDGATEGYVYVGNTPSPTARVQIITTTMPTWTTPVTVTQVDGCRDMISFHRLPTFLQTHLNDYLLEIGAPVAPLDDSKDV